jgi:hypothetical protein
MSFDTEKEKVDSLKICLFEIDIPVDNDVLINHEAGIWFNKLSPGLVEVTDDDNDTGSYSNTNSEIYNIQSVVVDGLSYLKVDSVAALRLNTEAFYYDLDNTELYIHFANSDPPLAKSIKLGNVNGFITKVDEANGAYYNDIYYDPRILNLPILAKSKDPLFFGRLRFDAAAVSLINTDGFFDNYEDNDVYGQPARIRLGFEGLDIDDFETIYTGFVQDFDYDFDKFTVKLLNNRKKISRVLPIRRFTDSEYTGLLDKDEQRVRPLAYGIIRNAPCILIEDSDPYTFMFMDTTDHNAGALTKVYRNGSEVPVDSSDLTAGTFVLTSSFFSDGDEITADFTGATGIANGLEVIRDLLEIYANTNFNAFNYNVTEWNIAEALAYDVGLYIGEEKKINKVIEEILVSVGAAFFDQADGKWTARVYDENRTPVKAIQSDEWLSDPKKTLPSKEFLSSAKINFNKDITEDKFEEHTNDTYDLSAFNQYKRREQRSFDTLLTSRPNAVARSETIMTRSKVVLPTVSRKASFANISLELMDFVIAEHDRVSVTNKNWGVYEIINRSPDIKNAANNLIMKFVKDYDIPIRVENWTHRDSDGLFSSTFNAVAYGSSLFVVAGDSGEIQTSPNGITWTARTAAGGYSDRFRAIAYGNNLFVIVGELGEIQTSPDGITWTARTADGGYSEDFRAIAYGNNLFVATGEDGEIQTSPDGITWTARTADVTIADTFRSAVFGNNLFVIAGNFGKIMTSPDGITWTVRTADGGFSNTFVCAAYGNDVFVLAGGSGEIQTSPDGITWTARTAADSYSNFFRGASFGSDVFVLAGDSGEIQTSPDGITWTVQIAANLYTGSFVSVSYGNDIFISVGSLAEIQTSIVESYVV